MARVPSEEQEHEKTNGTNGTAGYWVASEQESEVSEPGIQLRKNLALLAVTGNMGDAQSLYFAVPGSTVEGWILLERSLLPLRKFVLDGETPYIGIFSAETPWGVPTPAGDCAEDALPLEARNPYREAEKRRVREKGD